jgi:hypothetical protein
MTHIQHTTRARRQTTIFSRLAMTLFALTVACSHGHQPEGPVPPPPDPIAVIVRNENFLDMNVAVVAGGASRRLGTVNGNNMGQFKLAWSVANGQSLVLTAVPIGGQGVARSAALNVSPGQVIEFKIGSVLRQSVAVVHEP